MSNRSHVSDLRAAALPFVTRALRGPRLQRFTILSAILALFTVALGLWAGLSANSAARGFRTSVDLEESIYERIHQEFVVFADDEREAARLREMVQRQLHGSEDPDGDLGDDHRQGAKHLGDGGLVWLRPERQGGAGGGTDDS